MLLLLLPDDLPLSSAFYETEGTILRMFQGDQRTSVGAMLIMQLNSSTVRGCVHHLEASSVPILQPPWMRVTLMTALLLL